MRMALALICYLEPALINCLAEEPEGLFNLLTVTKQECLAIMSAEDLVALAMEPRFAHVTTKMVHARSTAHRQLSRLKTAGRLAGHATGGA